MYTTLTEDEIRSEICDLASFCWHEFDHFGISEKCEHICETLRSEGFKVIHTVRLNCSAPCRLEIIAKDESNMILEYDLMIDGFGIEGE